LSPVVEAIRSATFTPDVSRALNVSVQTVKSRTSLAAYVAMPVIPTTSPSSFFHSPSTATETPRTV
jgi:hypothetical protein